MKNIGIFYGSTTGNSEAAAYRTAGELGLDNTRVFNVSGVDIHEIFNYHNIILGCSTWDMGELQVNFEFFLSRLKRINLKGKKIAIFGCGDQAGYPGTFADSIGIIYESLQNSGCEFIGALPVDGYKFSCSKALKGDLFLGLPLDEINQSELSLQRIKRWVEILKKDFYQ